MSELVIDFLLFSQDLLPLGLAVKLFGAFATTTSALRTITVFGIHYAIRTTREAIFTRRLRNRTVGENGLILNEPILFSSFVINRHVAAGAWPTRENQENKKNTEPHLPEGEWAVKVLSRTKAGRGEDDVTDLRDVRAAAS